MTVVAHTWHVHCCLALGADAAGVDSKRGKYWRAVYGRASRGWVTHKENVTSTSQLVGINA